MSNIVAWLLFLLGIAHLTFGILVCNFATLLMLPGQVAIHAVAVGDLWLLRLIAGYVFVTSLIGFAAWARALMWSA